MNAPKVSIICRTYNQEEIVELAIESALNQTFKDYELIIIDDASTDNTYAKIHKFHDQRIKIIKNTKNKGPIATLNMGITEAIGEYISILDGDDEYLPRKLEKQVEYLDKNPDYNAIFSYINTIGDINNPKILNNSNFFKSIINNPAGTRAEMLRKCFGYGTFLAFPSEMFRKRYAVLFPEHLLALSETNFHISILLYSNIKVLEEPLVNYRVVENYENKWCSSLSLENELFFLLDRFLEIKDIEFFKEVFKNDIVDFNCIEPQLLPYILSKIAEKEIDNRRWANYNFHRYISSSQNYQFLVDTLQMSRKEIMSNKRGLDTNPEKQGLLKKIKLKLLRLLNSGK